MLRRRLTHLCLRFNSQTREELRRHHLRRALDHALAHARDRAPNLHVARVSDFSAVPILREIEVARTFEKTRRAFALDDHAKVLRLAQVFELDLAFEHSLDRTDTGTNRR